ncbi:hypothetical protein FRB90_004799, partial [Tulasnella sp. 427]
MNAISVYVHWGLTNPAPGIFDFEEYRALEPLFTMAMEIGLWIVLRPGPYINAETTGGGIPHWVTSYVSGHLRTNDTTYYQAWRPYIDKVAELVAPYQITRGGPVIAVQLENEYVDRDDVGYPGKREMMNKLKVAMKSGGIEVPLTINDAYMGANYVNGTGSGDIYGFDAYPQGFDCAHPHNWKPVVDTYTEFHNRANPHQPLYIPEFQGGAYDPWGPGAPGYESCAVLTNAEFESVFHLSLFASNAKMINIYMIYGGTSWGHLPFPGVYTSYDYGAAIAENRDIRPEKYAEIKRQGFFLRSIPDFYKTDILPGGSWKIMESSGSPPIAGKFLQNPDNESGFLIVRHKDSTLTESSSFHIKITVSPRLQSQWNIPEVLQIPQLARSISLDGRQSKILSTFLGSPPISPLRRNTLLYSTAAILLHGWMAEREVLIFTGDSSQDHEFAVELPHGLNVTPHPFLQTSIHPAQGRYTIVHILQGLHGIVPVHESDDKAIYFVDTASSSVLWAPILQITGPESLPFPNFWSIGSNSSIAVHGPALVRSTSFSPQNNQLRIVGDLDPNLSIFLTIIGAPPTTKSITWNGQEIGYLGSSFAGDRFRLSFPMHSKVAPPDYRTQELTDWEYLDSLPEVNRGFNDSGWATANHTTTNLAQKPYSGKHVLYGCDYGFCEGVVIWRGHFNFKPQSNGVTLTINGGQGFAASIYINDIFIRTTYGNSSSNRNIVTETTEWYPFPNGALIEGENVVTVVQMDMIHRKDNMGLDETWNRWDTDGSRSPRGIRGYELRNGQFLYWKVQGKLGGYRSYPDRKRGVFNEGGLHGERMGWHRPETPDDQGWFQWAPQQGLPPVTRWVDSNDVVQMRSRSGVGFFRTYIKLDMRPGVDTMQTFEFVEKGCAANTPTIQPYRAWLFVNGWMMGKRIANLG